MPGFLAVQKASGHSCGALARVHLYMAVFEGVHQCLGVLRASPEEYAAKASHIAWRRPRVQASGIVQEQCSAIRLSIYSSICTDRLLEW